MAPIDKPDPYALTDSGTKNPPPARAPAPGAIPGPAPGAVPLEPAASAAADAPSDRFSVHLTSGVHVITLSRSDVLDGYYIRQLGTDLKAYMEPIPAPRIVLDLANVRFMSSAALGMLLELRAVAKAHDGAVALANVQPDILEVFKITKLNKILKLHDSTEQAVKAVGK